MAAGLGFKDFVTGEVLTAADVDGYLMQGIWVFASAAARDAAVTSPQEGNFAFTKDTNSLWYYDGAAWVASGAAGDIEGVTAGIGISGGGTSGTVTVTNSMATAIDAKGDLVVGTGADTFSKLTVGANGTTLLADSAEATGLKWATAASGGITLLSTTTLSGASTTITVAANSYKQLIAVAEGIDASANHNPSLQINSVTGGYINARYGAQGNPTTQQRIASSDNSAWLGWQSVEGYGTDTDNIATTYFFNPNDTRLKNVMTYTSYYGSSTSAYAVLTNVVTVPTSAVISSIVYKTDSSFTAGTVKVYGVN